MSLTLLTKPDISQDKLQINIYGPRSFVSWLLDRPRPVVSSQFFPGRVAIGNFSITSESPLEFGQKLNATFGSSNYLGIMPLYRIGTSTTPYTYECCVDNIEETE